jgi:thiol-disulfide isomerase/thioredoxin
MQAKQLRKGLTISLLVVFFLSFAWLTVKVKTMKTGMGMGTGIETLPLQEPAPDFSLKDLEGREWSLSELKGKVVMIDFWATWCQPCKAEMPMLGEIHQKYNEYGFELLAVDVGEDENTVRKFVEELDVDLPILMDEESRVSNLYKVQAFPTSFLIDTSGILQYVHVGLDPFLHSQLTGEIYSMIPDTLKEDIFKNIYKLSEDTIESE